MILCLSFLFGCGENIDSSLERRVAILEAASNVPTGPIQLTEPEGVDWAKWVSSFATLLAVFTSLWLANRDRLIRLVVEPKIKNDDFTVLIANVGRRDAVVVSVEAYLRFSKRHFSESIFGGGNSQNKLEDGDFKYYSSESFVSACREQSKSFSRLKRVLLKTGIIGVITEVKVSTGSKYSAFIRLR